MNNLEQKTEVKKAIQELTGENWQPLFHNSNEGVNPENTTEKILTQLTPGAENVLSENKNDGATPADSVKGILAQLTGSVDVSAKTAKQKNNNRQKDDLFIYV